MMPNIPVKNCCGCTACVYACPIMAVKMELDSEGFLYPMVDHNLCVECKKCEQVCPLLTPQKLPEKFEGSVVAQSKCEDVLRESTSGGFVDALCKYVIENKGYVAGVTFDENFMPHHKIVNTYEEAKKFRNSKYAQSNLGNIFSEIKALLNDGEKVMFVGTPCQVGGLKTFIGHNENLITVDLVCRSIPSSKLWEMYLDFQTKRYKSSVMNVYFRKKTYGYHSGTLEIEFENGKHYKGSNRVDYYMKSFHSDICSRPSCYECNFKTKHRVSDFTVFDCWYPDLVSENAVKDNDKGFSNVLVHTKKGMEILQNLNEINVYPANAEKMFLYTGGMESKSIDYKENRKVFYNEINKYGFEKAIKRQIKVSFLDRLIEIIKPFYYCIKKK